MDILDPILVRLLGDASSVLKAFRDTEAAANSIRQNLERQGQEIQRLAGTLQGYARAAAGVLNSIGVAGRFQEAIQVFGEWESAEMRLTAALQHTADQAGETAADYRAFVDSMQEATTVGNTQTMALLQQAVSFGLMGGNAKEAVRNAISLSAVTGRNANSLIRMTIALEQGNTMLLGRFLPAIRGIKNETEKAARAHEILGAMFDSAKAHANSLAGQFMQLRNALKEVLYNIGGILAEGLRPAVGAIKDLARWFINLEPSTKRTIVLLMGVVGGAAALLTALSAIPPILGTVIGLWKGLGASLLSVFLPLGNVLRLFLLLRYAFLPLAVGVAALNMAWGLLGTALGLVLTGLRAVAPLLGGALLRALLAGLPLLGAWTIAAGVGLYKALVYLHAILPSVVAAIEALVLRSLVVGLPWLARTAVELLALGAGALFAAGRFVVMLRWAGPLLAFFQSIPGAIAFAVAAFEAFVSKYFLLIVSMLNPLPLLRAGWAAIVAGFTSGWALIRSLGVGLFSGVIAGLLAFGRLVNAAWAPIIYLLAPLASLLVNPILAAIEVWNRFNILSVYIIAAVTAAWNRFNILSIYIIANVQKVASFMWMLLNPANIVAGIILGWNYAWAAGAAVLGALLSPLKMIGALATSIWGVLRLGIPALTGLLTLVMSLLNPVKIIQLLWSGVLATFTLIGSILSSTFVLWGGIAIAVLAIVAAVGAVGLILYEWVKQVGGIGEAWKIVRAAAVGAWEWLLPVRQALYSLWQTVLELAGPVWAQIKEVAGSVLESVFGTGNIDDWRDAAVEAILALEFGLRNLGPVWDLVETYARYSLLRIGNQIEYLFTELIPAAWDWFLNNWKEVLTLLGNLFVNVCGLIFNTFIATMQAVAKGAVGVFSNLPAIIAKKMTLGEAIEGSGAGAEFAKVKRSFNKLVDDFNKDREPLDPFAAPDREEGPNEAEMRAEWEQKAAAMGVSWEQFRKKKLEEFEKNRNAREDGEDKGKQWGDGFKQGLGRLDAVLVNSAAAMTRLSAYQDLVNSMKTASNAEPVGMDQVPFAQRGEPGAPDPNRATPAELEEAQKQTDLLKQLLDEMKAQSDRENAKKAEIEIAGADL